MLRGGSSAQPFPGSSALDEAIEQAIASDQIPGAVLLVAHQGRILHQKAYGARALEPAREEMTLDTIFDVASLTKVVATTSAILKLVEDGKLRLNDRVTAYLPEFQGGKSEITIRLLMTHFSGLRPDLDLIPAWSGHETGIQKALLDVPVALPGERFIYSDINFILLGEIVRRASGQTLDEFVHEKVFAPLGMHDTMFRPRGRAAPAHRAHRMDEGRPSAAARRGARRNHAFHGGIDIPVCLLTNIDNVEIQTALQFTGLKFAFVVTSEDCRAYKPRPEVFQKALTAVGIPPHRSCMSGILYQGDVIGAQSQGIPVLWIDRRHRPLPPESTPPEYTAPDLNGLTDLLRVLKGDSQKDG